MLIGSKDWTQTVLNDADKYFAWCHIIPDEEDRLSYLLDVAEEETGFTFTVEDAEQWLASLNS